MIMVSKNITVYGIKQSKQAFFGWTNVWKHVLIQIELMKNNQVNLIIDYILVNNLYSSLLIHNNS